MVESKQAKGGGRAQHVEPRENGTKISHSDISYTLAHGSLPFAFIRERCPQTGMNNTKKSFLFLGIPSSVIILTAFLKQKNLFRTKRWGSIKWPVNLHQFHKPMIFTNEIELCTFTLSVTLILNHSIA
ncbi:hypothetical protein OUZ56_031965 [Daphnia magna]|uniref:Uncharacterized protein n=1 Tax=Daphnia magna TaxID=35525 RepID=A0ABQ9ZVT4_9CRUS|nr:hypothetical protein OUZ56_031965 [Daphnia magna]